MKTYAELLEASFPKKTRLDFTNHQLTTLNYKDNETKVEVVFIPMAQYLRAIEALTWAENVIRQLEATESATPQDCPLN